MLWRCNSVGGQKPEDKTSLVVITPLFRCHRTEPGWEFFENRHWPVLLTLSDPRGPVLTLTDPCSAVKKELCPRGNPAYLSYPTASTKRHGWRVLSLNPSHCANNSVLLLLVWWRHRLWRHAPRQWRHWWPGRKPRQHDVLVGFSDSRSTTIWLHWRDASHTLIVYSSVFSWVFAYNAMYYGTLKPHSNGPLYSNTVIGTLAVDGWAVTLGTARRGLGGLRPRPVLSSLYHI